MPILWRALLRKLALRRCALLTVWTLTWPIGPAATIASATATEAIPTVAPIAPIPAITAPTTAFAIGGGADELRVGRQLHAALILPAWANHAAAIWAPTAIQTAIAPTISLAVPAVLAPAATAIFRVGQSFHRAHRFAQCAHFGIGKLHIHPAL